MAGRSSLIRGVALITLASGVANIYWAMNPAPPARRRLLHEVLPMRPGEFVRSYIASRWMGASFVTILPSIILERLFDGVWMAMGVGMAAIFAPLPEYLIEAGETFGAIIALIVALFIYLVLRRPRPRPQQRPGIAACRDGNRCEQSPGCSSD